MKKLLKYLTKGYMKETVLAPLFKCIEAVFELFVPLVVAQIIDVGIKNGDKSYVVFMCLVLVGLGLAGLAFSITAQFFAAKAATGFSKTVGNALFRHIQKFSYTDLDELGTSTLMTRMTSDLNQVQTGVNMTLRLLLRSPFIVFGAMIMAFTIDVNAALVFAAAIPVLSIVVFGIMLAGMPLYGKVRAGLDKLLGRTRENLSGARVVRAFCIED
ncbi:MAG: ABC transporter ATP-binding protein, partial [Clostridia bacterium]|nr:ABC transporter ATP-binding protein [Clostridia bacterium]